jgi:SAM-dependent methyltransferase
MTTIVEPATAVAGPTTDPSQLLQLAEGMHAIEVVAAAVGWLGLFERLDAAPADTCAIAEELELAERTTHVMLTLFRSLGLVHRDDDGAYSLTRLASEYLLPQSPWSVAPVFEALAARPACREMLRVLRTGAPLTFAPDDDGDGWADRMSDEMFAEMFLTTTDSRNTYLAHALAASVGDARFGRLLDVGGGSGIYASALAQRNPRLRATVFEKPPVDTIARRALARRGLAGRVDAIAGDMLLDELPHGYDAHLFSNVVHDWEERDVARLLRASFEALVPGGTILVHDALLDEDGDGPLPVAQYSVLLMAFTAGRCYSLRELTELLRAAGFEDVAHTRTVVDRTLVTAVKPD